MSISSGLLAPGWLWSSALAFSLILMAALWRAPWQIVLRRNGIQHLVFGATVLLILMWTLRAGISPGLSIHFLGITALTLILGWDLAVICATVALLVMSVIGLESWQGLGVNGLLAVALPAGVTLAILTWVERSAERNFFIYLLVCGFVGAGVSIALCGLAMGALLWLDGVYPWQKIHHEYVRYIPLIMFPEGLLNGILMTGVMVFPPDWIRTFDAKAYIDDQ